MKRIVLAFLLIGCSLLRAGDKAEITLVQINDVYEMMPLNSRSGTEGGLAKVATLIKQLKAENPNTFSLLAGDFLSPSALGLAQVPKPGGGLERLDGRQMVDALNTMGLNFATFGNHEFDLGEAALRARIKESKFTWINSNVTNIGDEYFPGTITYMMVPVRDGDQQVRIGLFAVTLDVNRPKYVGYRNDYLAVARDMASALEALGAEIVVGLTHLTLAEDLNLAENVKGLDLILGGHEHENIQVWRGSNMVPVFKADANARTVYIHRLSFEWATRKLSIRSELKRIDENIPDDPATKTVVDHWTKLAFDAFRAQGIEPDEKIAIAKTDLDGRESSIRNGETVLTHIISDSMLLSGAQGSLYNSGGIRIDDVIHEGQTITMYDVLRILPYGGNLIRTEIKGALLSQTLDKGMTKKGSGGFLQRSEFGGTSGAWTLGEKPIDAGATYKIVLNDFLLEGKEEGFEFLKVIEKNDKEEWVIQNRVDLKVIDPAKDWPDMRKALADQLRKDGLAVKK